MGLLDYYKQFEALSDEEVSQELRARAEERRRRALARIDTLDLSKTTWHEFPHPDVVAAVTFAIRRGINRAPDAESHGLRHELAMRLGVEPDRVVAGNGAAGLLRTAAAMLLGEGDELVTPWPSYPLYPLMARDAGARAVPVPGFDPAALADAVNERTRVLVVCNPNDPTGEHLRAGELDDLLRGLRDHVTVLVDEALVDFVDDEPGGGTLALLDDHPRLLLFRTFSKVYGLAGLRVGYAVGAEGSGSLLRSLAPPLGLAEPQQAGALEARHACAGQVAARREQVVVERRRLLDELTSLPVNATPSQANVLWLRAEGVNGGELARRLQRHGVIVAPGGPLGDDACARASIQRPAAGDRLLRALELSAGR